MDSHDYEWFDRKFSDLRKDVREDIEKAVTPVNEAVFGNGQPGLKVDMTELKGFVKYGRMALTAIIGILGIFGITLTQHRP
jgi:hypothetical protein